MSEPDRSAAPRAGRAQPLRVIDSGLGGGRANNMLDSDELARHVRGVAADRLRFYRNLPTASIGRHQVIDRELRIDHCHANGITLVRRPTGGGAVYLDPGQLCYSLLVRRPAEWRGFTLERLLAQFCETLGDALRRLGVAARYKYPNDLEIDGRKIATAFAYGEAQSILLQAVLLLDVDIRSMLEALRVPTEKLSPDGLGAARQRLITLRECLGALPDMARLQAAIVEGLATLPGLRFATRIEAAALPDAVRAARPDPYRLDWRDTERDAIEALCKGAAATLRARAEFDAGERLVAIEFGGDVHVRPADLFERLQRGLQGVAATQLEQRASELLAACAVDPLGFDAGDIARLLHLLLEKLSLRGCGFSARQLNALMPYAPHGERLRQLLDDASVMLVPYCAKPPWCEWRTRDACPECGGCEVGDAYGMARERGMEVITITHYEHLVATLAEMKARGVQAYLGMCCSSFFIKRQRAFAEAGMGALLMDISGANCYELKQEEDAYAGRFEAQAQLDTALLQQVIRFVPRRAPRAGSA